ncbi:nitrate- and nitrite sensing domain-containing protein [Streptomyces sp. DSM 44918]|uniref:histidine kinase n=1 Tax=Streptomyces millisiae TaxID=3075542 RepID=A0ABU2LYG3_9ACTN|nr:nitrate- and nitrite sensing domain-containing protein [Streptomyces sp. DSM 44918]MDT0322635.1 nitrate- and nitrite sensing domain-containing protein [Streptomyces sp. DSM 44918]
MDRGSSAGSGPGGGDPAQHPAGGEQPAQEPAATGAEESPAPARPSHAGSRLALRNWRISTRLVSLIALPVVAATILGGFRIQNSMEDIEKLDDLQLLTDMTQVATQFAQALQEERDRSAGPLVSNGGLDRNSDEVVAAREQTNQALRAFSDARLRLTDTDEAMRGVISTVINIGRQVNEISTIRRQAYEDPENVGQTISAYNNLIDSLHNLSLDMAQATSNGEMIRSTRALAAFSSAKEHASIQRAVITAGLARDEIQGQSADLSDADWRLGRNSSLSEEAQLEAFAQIYGQSRANDRLAPLEGGVANITQADQYAQRVFSAPEGIRNSEERSYRNWYEQDRTKIDAMNVIEAELLAEMQAQANALRDEAQQEAVINGAVVILVLGISLVGAFVVARSMVRSLRRLQETATEVARKRLPEVVKQMSEAEPEEVDTTVESVGVYTRDEIGKVAQAFDDVHREAVRLAGEQALLRGNVNAMFTNLSRRSQGLIQRQLSLISELESREADPDQLSSLFKLDHLATRMRRNGENLLVLAGEEPGRRWTRPVPLVDVLRAAASEVEQYERIELSAVPKTEVAGRVVNDLVHLLAELLENATSFSSPQTKVKVTGHALPDGRVLVEIHDTGIGLSPEDLAEINDRLANPPTVDVSVSRRMGLFVVGRLSLRHGIRIQLRPSDSGGTTALVMLPADVAQGGARPRPAAPSTAPATATLQRETPPTRRPGGEAGGPALDGRRAAGQPAGWQRSLERSESTRQVPRRPSRPELPSRPVGASGPGTPGPRQGGPHEPPAAPPSMPEPAMPGGTGGTGGGRPSWASMEDSGRIPVVRGESEQPRGHDDGESAGTGEFPRPGYGGGQSGAPSRSSMADAFARREPRQQPSQPPARPEDTGEFGFPPARQAPIPDPVAGYRAASDPAEFNTREFPAVRPDEPPQRRPEPRRDAWSEPERDWSRAEPARQPEPQPQSQSYQREEPRPAPYQRQEPPRAPDELRDPLPSQRPQHAPERTPIFEEMESTWFGLRRASAPTPYPSREPAGSRQSPQQSAQPVQQRPASPARPAVRQEQRQTTGEIGAPWRPSPNDETWRQAEQLRQPSAGGVTDAGLPRRVPRANLMAGAAQPAQQQAAPAGPMVSRSPDDVRGRLTNLRRGIQQGRQAGSTAGRTDRGFGPMYQ